MYSEKEAKDRDFMVSECFPSIFRQVFSKLIPYRWCRRSSGGDSGRRRRPCSGRISGI